MSEVFVRHPHVPSRLLPQVSAKTAVTGVYVVGMTLSTLNASIVNVALPDIARDFGIGSTSIDIVATSYFVGLAIIVPMAAWIGDRFGASRVLMLSLAGFTVASLGCGLTTNLAGLAVARAAQGLSGGVVTTLGIAILYRLVPPRDRIALAAVIVIPPSLGQALGPVVGGFVTHEYGWRWNFLGTAVLGACAVTFALLYLREDKVISKRPVDLLGLTLAVMGLPATIYGLSEIADAGVLAPRVLVCLGVGLSSLGAFVWQELHIDLPMLDLRLLKDRLFAQATGILTLASVVNTGWVFLSAQFLQNVWGLSASDAGLALLPQTIGVVVGVQIASRLLYPRLGPRRTTSVGLVCLIGALTSQAFLTSTTAHWPMLVAMGIAGVASPIVFQSIQAAGFTGISPDDTARATSLYNSMRQVGGAAGIAGLSIVLAATSTANSSELISDPGPYRWAFTLQIAITLVSLAIALRIDDRAAADTFGPHPRRETVSVLAGIGAETAPAPLRSRKLFGVLRVTQRADPRDDRQ